MKVAVIAWGSLIWEPDALKVADAFTAQGPLLPIEFCRVSTAGVRKDILTLVIDPDDGTLCKTYAAPSAFVSLEEAIDNLRDREGTPARTIGFVDLASGKRGEAAVESHPEAIETIAAWAEASGYDAAIWTALASNFDDRVGEPFSITAAIAYLEKLERQDAETFAAALAYIRNAPPEVDTAVRGEVARRWGAAPA
ncbi:hypothetical protein DFR50_13640 [Roseiarcus fermentans]|uniref:Uncharacterized protein n=1 Tax=Roseiarcus fermentans TaxID=1473586 RepID=A0A366ERY9_9HYPH|nr:hypothetical protein [Roseiarcus fermentans]RBP05151.1 hypothetical protein DFR50_13640 [Roseiarcus fermentans]